MKNRLVASFYAGLFWPTKPNFCSESSKSREEGREERREGKENGGRPEKERKGKGLWVPNLHHRFTPLYYYSINICCCANTFIANWSLTGRRKINRNFKFSDSNKFDLIKLGSNVCRPHTQ